MDVQSHVVAQPVRLEEACDTLLDHVVDASAHYVKRTETLEHEPGGSDVHVAVGGSRPGQGEGKFIAVAHDLVDVPLPGGETASGGKGAREVGCVVHVVLGAGIDDKELTGLDHLVVEVVVEGFPVLGKDGRERHAPSLGEGHAFHDPDNLLLQDSGLDVVAGHGVHQLSQRSCIVELLDLARFLDKAHGDHGLDQFLGSMPASVLVHRGHPGHVFGGHSCQGGEFHRVEISARREEVDLAAGGKGCLDHGADVIVRSRPSDSRQGGLRGHGRLRAHPDDVAEFDVVCEYALVPGVEVDHGCHERLVNPEIVQPGRVLAELVGVVPVLGGRFGVADEQGDSPLPLGGGLRHLLQQGAAARDVDFFCKHIQWKVVSIHAKLSKITIK